MSSSAINSQVPYDPGEPTTGSRRCCAVAERETFGPARYHEQFIMFTGSENADCLVLDLLPEPGGRVGQIVLFCTQAPQIMVLAPDLLTFLQSLAADYKKGRFKNNPCDYFVSYVES